MSLQHDQSLETVYRVIDSIWACAVEHDRWPETLGMIAELSHSRCCIFGLDRTTGIDGLAYQVGFDGHYLQLLRDKYGKVCPYNRLLRTAPTGTIVTSAAVVQDPKYWESEYYHRWFKPQGLIDWLGFKALDTGRRSVKLAALRHEDQGRFGTGDVQTFSRIAPYVCRSLEISNICDTKAITSMAFEETLDAVAAGIFLIDLDGRVLFMNCTAQDQITAGDALMIKDDRLTLVDKTGQTALIQAIIKALSDKAPLTSVAVPSTNGSGLVATVLPLSRRERKRLFPTDAAAAIFVQSALGERHLPSQAFAGLYGLTHSELRVLRALAVAHGIKDTAATLRISEPTVKTHLQRIYAKTGTSNQKDLMTLFAHSVLRRDRQSAGLSLKN